MRYLSSKDGETQMHVETSSKQRCKDRRARMMRRDWQQHARLTTAHQPTAYQRVGTRPGGHCDTWPSRIDTDYHKTKLFCWWNIFDVMCRMGRWSFWSWFDVNRSNFRRICAKNDFYIFVASDLDLWPLDLTLAPLITPVQRYVFTKLEFSIQLSYFKKNRGTGRTDTRTGCNM